MKATILLVFALLGIVSCQTCTQSKTVPYSVSASGLTLDLINTYGIPYQVVYSEDTTQIEVYASSDVLLDRISVSTNETNGILQVILDDSCGCYGISGANCDNGTCVCTNTGVAPSGLSCSNPSNPNTDESSFAIGKIAPSFISLAIGYICCLFFANHKQSIFIVLFASILFSSVSMSHSQSNCSDLYVVIKGPITSQLTITTGTTGTMTTGGSTTGGNTAACNMGSSPGSAVQQPVSVATVDGQVSWFASPLIYDLDKDGKNEIIAAYASLYIYDSAGTQITSASGSNRVYAPHVIADLDGDGQVEIVIGNGKYVYAYNYAAKKLSVKSGWPADTTTGGQSPEVRGMSAADLNGDGKIEIIVTTTQTVSASKGGSQVFVFSYDGTLYQPAGGHSPAWPRYNSLTGDGNDADVNIAGQDGYGCYGLNVGVGNIDGDSNLEIIVTYDNHFIQAFKHDGVTINTTPAYTRRETPRNARLTWGQMVRWADYGVEIAQYVNHSGVYPCVCNDPPQEWLQWTASPPSIIDIDLDGQNEVIGIPNIESGEPYVTQAYGVFVIQGDYPGNKSAVRKPGWENFPRGNTPITVEGYYPPLAPPTPSFANLQGDAKLEILAPLNDGFLYCFSSDNQLLWKYDFTHGKTIMFVTEAVVADLNQDGSPEVVFATFGDPNVDSGYLVILDANGNMLFDMLLPDTGYNGNGNGAPAAPTIGDIDGDGTLEILVQTFDHGMNIFNVPGSQTNCVLWPTARGGLLRKGQPDGY